MVGNKDFESRENIHLSVWMYPLPEAARDLGISPDRLRKICRHHNIPIPRKRYWDMVIAGQKHAMDVLPKSHGGPQRRISLLNDPSVATAQQSRSITPPPPTAGTFHPMLQHWLTEHHIAREKALEQARYGNGRPVPENPTPADIYRLGVTSQFLYALEAAGGTVKKANLAGMIEVRVSNERLKCVVAERMERSVPNATPVEGWTAWPEHHNPGLQPSGFLRLTLNGHSKPLQRLERSSGTASALIPKFIEDLQIAAASITQKRRQDEAAKEGREAALWQREAERKKAERDDARWTHFRARAADWEECQRLIGFLAALRAGAQDTEIEARAFGDWLVWAEARITALNPLSDPPSVFEAART